MQIYCSSMCLELPKPISYIRVGLMSRHPCRVVFVTMQERVCHRNSFLLLAVQTMFGMELNHVQLLRLQQPAEFGGLGLRLPSLVCLCGFYSTTVRATEQVQALSTAMGRSVTMSSTEAAAAIEALAALQRVGIIVHGDAVSFTSQVHTL